MVGVKGKDALRIWLYVNSSTKGYREKEFLEILEKYRLTIEDAGKIAAKFEKVVFGEQLTPTEVTATSERAKTVSRSDEG